MNAEAARGRIIGGIRALAALGAALTSAGVLSMGGFYGSIHCRTDDRGEVIRAVEALARKLQTRFLVGPPISGWVAVYPEVHGQDERVSRALGRKLRCPLLHVLVHDDDFLAYVLYRDGRLADRFHSCPDYFGEVPAGSRRKLRGRPELLVEFLVDPREEEDLRGLLTQDRSHQPVFAVESLTRLAELLGLPNAVTSYEYLQDGERDDIQGWNEFVHIPDQSAERARERSADDAQAQWKEDGLLLVEEFGQGPGAAATWPHVCPAPDGDGFLVFWGSSLSQDRRPLWVCRGPAFSPPEDTGLRLEATAWRLCLSHSGRFLGVGHASGNWSAEVWDLGSRSRLVQVPVRRAVEWIGFSPDDRHLASLSEGEFRVADLEGGEVTAYAAPRPGRCGVGIHPEGTLVVGDGAGCLTLCDLLSGRIVKRLFVGGKRDLGPALRQGRAMARRRLAELRCGDWEAELREKLRTEIEKMKSQLGRGGMRLPPGMDPDKLIEAMEKGLEDTISRMKEQMEKAADQPDDDEPAEQSAVGAVSITCLEISPDGRWLSCGTAAGVLAFTWEQILKADEVPVPEHHVGSPPVTHRKGAVAVTMPDYVQTLVHDSAGKRLLFAGEAGVVRELDLRNGISAVLLAPPRRLGILQMCLTADSRALCCVCRPQVDQGRGPPVQQIWSLDRLDERRLRLAAPEE